MLGEKSENYEVVAGVEAEYLEWMFERRKKFIVWVALAVMAYLLYFTFHDIYRVSNSSELLTVLSLRAIEIFFTICVVYLFLRVKPLLAQKLLFLSMLIITVAAVFDSYFWVKNINHAFNPSAEMFAVYIFMIIPLTSVLHKFVLGLIFTVGIFACSHYLKMPFSNETVFFVLVIFISEVAISYKIDGLLRIQFKAIHDEKRQTDILRQREYELKQALEAERQAIKQNLNFIDMISHEYRTPLSIITSSLDSLETLDIVSESDEAADILITIREASRRLLSIYESSLHEKRINASGLMPYKKPVDILSLVELAADFVRNVYPEHSILIEDNISIDMVIEADKELLTTAFINLLDNACKYSLPSKVRFVLQQKDSECLIEIIDEGYGIGSSEIEAIFEKYYRCNKNKQKPGAGLGLYLVKKILELHKGSIKIESSLNAGTKVTVIIPLDKDMDNDQFIDN